MRMQWSRLLWALIGLGLAVGLPARSVGARQPDSASFGTAADVIAAVNSLRAAHGLPAYRVNSILMGTAQGQADFMASTGTIQHTGPGGITVTQRLLQAGYPLAGDLSLGGFRSENIVGGYGMTPGDAVDSWTGDDPHLHTMLSADLQEIGAGVAEADGMTYYVIDCARPTGSGVPIAYTPGAEAQLNGGNDIIVPVKLSTPRPDGYIVHEVQAGQTLWAIAIAYGVKINQIRQLNNLDPTSTVIQQGVKLLVKKVDTPTPGPTSTATPKPDTPTPEPTLSPATPTLIRVPSSTAQPSVVSTISGGGAVVAIVIAALAAAGLVAWFGRTRPI